MYDDWFDDWPDDELLAEAERNGIDAELADLALRDGEFSVIEQFVREVKDKSHDSHVINSDPLLWGVTRHLPQFASDDQRVDVLALMLDADGEEVRPMVLDLLSRLDHERARRLIREQLSAAYVGYRPAAARAVIRAEYADDHESALQDVSDLVRTVAVDRLEQKRETNGLLRALQNTLALVRSRAAWYMGWNRVQQAVQPLIALVETETDDETLRAGIWSLGVLRDRKALTAIRQHQSHANPRIIIGAREAIERIEARYDGSAPSS